MKKTTKSQSGSAVPSGELLADEKIASDAAERIYDRYRYGMQDTAYRQIESQETIKKIVMESIEKSRNQSESPTWPYVLAFAKRMEAKLEKNRHKGNREGWLHDDPDALLERVREEVCEMDTAMCEIGNATDFSRDWYAERIADEAADVANFCMMLADVYTTGQSANDELKNAGPRTPDIS